MSSKIQRSSAKPVATSPRASARPAGTDSRQPQHAQPRLTHESHRDTFIPAIASKRVEGGPKSAGQKIFDAAKSYEGTATGDLIQNAKTWKYQHQDVATAVSKFMDPSIDPVENCANFVGSILKSTGLADPKTRMFSVYDIDTALRSKEYQDKGWKAVDGPALTQTDKKPTYQDSLDLFLNAKPPFKPGDVVVFQTGQSQYGHVVIFAGMNAQGEPTFIGSNNVLSVDAKGKVSGADGKPLDPQPTYPNPATGDQQISTLTLKQLHDAIGSGCAVRSVFRAPESTPSA